MTPEDRPGETGERRAGEVRLAGSLWQWEAVPSPAEPDGEAAAPNPFLRWFEVTFRRKDDPEQEARARAGVAPGDWSEETLREVLRSVRTRTWRDDDGRLWRVRLRGWSERGISTEVAEAGEEGGRAIVFESPAGGEERRRAQAGVDSLTDPGAGGLQAVLEEAE